MILQCYLNKTSRYQTAFSLEFLPLFYSDKEYARKLLWFLSCRVKPFNYVTVCIRSTDGYWETKEKLIFQKGSFLLLAFPVNAFSTPFFLCPVYFCVSGECAFFVNYPISMIHFVDFFSLFPIHVKISRRFLWISARKAGRLPLVSFHFSYLVIVVFTFYFTCSFYPVLLFLFFPCHLSSVLTVIMLKRPRG